MESKEIIKTTTGSPEELDVLMRLKEEGSGHMKEEYLRELVEPHNKLTEMEKNLLHQHLDTCPSCRGKREMAWRQMVEEDLEKAS